MRAIPFGPVVSLCLGLAGVARAADPVIPDTEAGRRVAAYVESSNSDDLVKMAIALQDGVLLTKPWAAWILQGGDAPWPAPATSDTPRGRLTEGGIGFAGGAPGVSAAMEWELDDDTMVVVLSNLDPPLAPGVAGKVVKWASSHP